jgi:hypothetical protein
MSYCLYVDLRVTLRRVTGTLSLDDIGGYCGRNIVQRKSLVPRLEFGQ